MKTFCTLQYGKKITVHFRSIGKISEDFSSNINRPEIRGFPRDGRDFNDFHPVTLTGSTRLPPDTYRRRRIPLGSDYLTTVLFCVNDNVAVVIVFNARARVCCACYGTCWMVRHFLSTAFFVRLLWCSVVRKKPRFLVRVFAFAIARVTPSFRIDVTLRSSHVRRPLDKFNFATRAVSRFCARARYNFA